MASHYFLLVSFFCMNVISYDMCRTFVSSLPLSKSRKRFKIYSYYSWGMPLVIIAAANILDRLPGLLDDLKDYRPEYASQVCWLNNRNAVMVFFILPIGAVLVENFFFFVMTIYGILNSRFQEYRIPEKSKNRSGSVKFAPSPEERRWGQQKNRVHFVIYLKLSVLMGLTWMFGFLASFLKLGFLWYPFIILNGLQGTFIFIFFDLKWKVYFTAYEKIMGKTHPKKSKHSKKKWMSQSSVNKEESKSDSGTKEQKKFKKKADLLVKILKWSKKEQQTQSFETLDRSLKKPLSKYNAWQQLKMFQDIISIENNNQDNEQLEQQKDEMKPSYAKKVPLKRQTKVDIETINDGSDDDDFGYFKPPAPEEGPPPYLHPPPYRRRLSSTVTRTTIIQQHQQQPTTIIQHHTLLEAGDKGPEHIQLWRFYVNNNMRENPAQTEDIGE